MERSLELLINLCRDMDVSNIMNPSPVELGSIFSRMEVAARRKTSTRFAGFPNARQVLRKSTNETRGFDSFHSIGGEFCLHYHTQVSALFLPYLHATRLFLWGSAVILLIPNCYRGLDLSDAGILYLWILPASTPWSSANSIAALRYQQFRFADF